MIIEDYVSFEIAKLLKEKGFVGESEIGDRCGFYEQNKEYPNQINLVYDDLNNSELECNECLRFTHQMAMKWLREVHKYLIVVGNKNGNYLYLIKDLKANTDLGISNNEYISYEEACEAAIKFCLENLI